MAPPWPLLLACTLAAAVGTYLALRLLRWARWVRCLAALPTPDGGGPWLTGHIRQLADVR